MTYYPLNTQVWSVIALVSAVSARMTGKNGTSLWSDQLYDGHILNILDTSYIKYYVYQPVHQLYCNCTQCKILLNHLTSFSQIMKTGLYESHILVQELFYTFSFTFYSKKYFIFL